MVVKHASEALQTTFLDPSGVIFRAFWYPFRPKHGMSAPSGTHLAPYGPEVSKIVKKITFLGVIFEPLFDQKNDTFLAIIFKGSFGGSAPLFDPNGLPNGSKIDQKISQNLN